jgi:hypothetical protein
MSLQDKLQASVKALDELSNNKRLAVTTRLALLEASDAIVEAGEAIAELMMQLENSRDEFAVRGAPEMVTHIDFVLAKFGGEQ